MPIDIDRVPSLVAFAINTISINIIVCVIVIRIRSREWETHAHRAVSIGLIGYSSYFMLVYFSYELNSIHDDI